MVDRALSYFAEIPYSIIRDIAERVAEINKKAIKDDEKVIDLSIGQNFLSHPDVILSKIEWIKAGGYREPILYEPSLGPKEVRDMIAKNFYPYLYDLSKDILDANNVMITDGAFGAVRNVLNAIMRPGDIIVVDRITFRYFLSVLKVFGRVMPNTRPRIIMATEDTGFVPTSSEIIDFLEKLKLMYPEKNIVYYTQFGFNPTGCFRSERELKEIAQYIENEKNLFLINDIAYHLVRWSKREIPLASILADEGAGIADADSLSKPFGLMGARVGALITRDENLFKYATRVQQYTIVSPSKFAVDIWKVVSERENLPEVDRYVKKTSLEIKELYEYFAKEIEQLGFDYCRKASGTIYTFVKVPIKSSILWKELLNKAKVAVVPGIAFTEPEDKVGEEYIRVTISVKRRLLEESLERIEKFVNKNLKT